ncbi:hypothetical protein B0T10DRAFT_498989 [Thelonectria olida]|uniref:Uncharacterized protein n=1 Tax=Thelonectria olida TaxID=1576542 RepID=A0A9P9AGX2_9HYPO|nr:hypothetical protein B0T10DRAFT_502847 [Thelonectria olida]KAH6873607.1 hypothetical protein B0T10DRAFT_499650 [Thelonectria olida]KAH6874270.1 hypothetical protein B0T10DRAFT_498989 [Thelonectria olida]
MCHAGFSKTRSTALFIGVSRRNIAPLSPLQFRTTPARTIATRPSSKQPNPFKRPAETMSPMQEHAPQPTESEEDVAADRSAIDPLHKPNPTESQENAMADRSPDDPLQQKVPR